MSKIITQNSIGYLLIFIFIVGTISNIFGQEKPANVPSEIQGTYFFKGKDGEKPFNFSFKFKSENAVFYSYEYKGAATIAGSWSVEKDVVTVNLPKDNAAMIFKFKTKGGDLEIVEKPQNVPMIIVGTVFKKYVNTPSAPTFSAKEISDKLLKFAKSIKTVKDVSPENIERQIGIKVQFNEENRTNYGFWGKITNSSWNYGLIAYPYPSANNMTTDTVRFSFDNETEHADIKTACVEIESVRKDLSKAGFSCINAYGSHSFLRGLIFSRDNLFIDVSVKGSFSDYESIKNNCVEMVIISAENAGKK
jgi:hypothetical protein